jgi:hypothetical protein
VRVRGVKVNVRVKVKIRVQVRGQKCLFKVSLLPKKEKEKYHHDCCEDMTV